MADNYDKLRDVSLDLKDVQAELAELAAAFHLTGNGAVSEQLYGYCRRLSTARKKLCTARDELLKAYSTGARERSRLMLASVLSGIELEKESKENQNHE